MNPVTTQPSWMLLFIILVAFGSLAVLLIVFGIVWRWVRLANRKNRRGPTPDSPISDPNK